VSLLLLAGAAIATSYAQQSKPKLTYAAPKLSAAAPI
jgi:hypothetical protein